MDWTSAMNTHYNKHAVQGDAIMRGMGRKFHSLQSKFPGQGICLWATFMLIFNYIVSKILSIPFLPFLGVRSSFCPEALLVPY